MELAEVKDRQKRSLLYRSGTFNVEVCEETRCVVCIHEKVCDQRMEHRCKNFRFGTSRYTGCEACVHRFTRWDGDTSLPCFICDDFLDERCVNE